MGPPPASVSPVPSAVRGTIHDNPWVGVEPLHSNNNSRDDGHNDDEPNNNNNARRRQGRVLHEGFWLQMLDIVIQILLCFDTCGGMFWVIFSAILHHKHKDSTAAVALMGVLGTLYLLRAKLVAAGLWISTDSVFSCQRGGLVVAGYTSLLLAVLLGGGTLLGLFCAKHVQAYMQTHSLDLTHGQIQWLLDHYGWVMGLLALSAAVEGMKWPIYGIYHRSLLLWEDEQERLENQNLIRREAATGRPWWWTNSNNGRQRRAGNPQLTQALLADDGNNNNGNENSQGGGDGSTTRRPRQRLGLFSLFRRSPAADTNARDDGSVDFASVQEEWASRAEEDPVWWSREDEEDDDGGGGMNNISRVTADVDTSWAHDVSQV